MRFNVLLAALCLAAWVPALAQPAATAPAATAPAPAATAPAPVTDEVPKHGCAKPGEFPGLQASDERWQRYKKVYVAYTECLRKFATEQQKLAQPHVKAANDTVNEYNVAIKAYNDEIDKRNNGK